MSIDWEVVRNQARRLRDDMTHLVEAADEKDSVGVGSGLDNIEAHVRRIRRKGGIGGGEEPEPAPPSPGRPEPSMPTNPVWLALRERVPGIIRLAQPATDGTMWPRAVAGRRWGREDEMGTMLVSLVGGLDLVQFYGREYAERLVAEALSPETPGSRNHFALEAACAYALNGETERLLYLLRCDAEAQGQLCGRGDGEQGHNSYEEVTVGAVTVAWAVAWERGDEEVKRACHDYLARTLWCLDLYEWRGEIYSPGQRPHEGAEETPKGTFRDLRLALRGGPISVANLTTRAGKTRSGGWPADLVLWGVAAARAAGAPHRIMPQPTVFRYPVNVLAHGSGILAYITVPMTDALIAIAAGDRVVEGPGKPPITRKPGEPPVQRWVVPHGAPARRFDPEKMELVG